MTNVNTSVNTASSVSITASNTNTNTFTHASRNSDTNTTMGTTTTTATAHFNHLSNNSLQMDMRNQGVIHFRDNILNLCLTLHQYPYLVIIFDAVMKFLPVTDEFTNSVLYKLDRRSNRDSIIRNSNQFDSNYKTCN